MALVFKAKEDWTRSSKFITVSHQCGIVEDKDVYFGFPSLLRDIIIFSKAQIYVELMILYRAGVSWFQKKKTLKIENGCSRSLFRKLNNDISGYAETLMQRKNQLILISNRISYIFSCHGLSMRYPSRQCP
jgi:hypothetical protein